ncbi:DUF2971 domain-containing protein [Paraburkholderia tropica]|uniref:DUF2971 domain-containing protein n=1 Tax=Paraburkholderia tropica TaxID=92647 RepID=UPI001F247395|nr:DUF2971 domain-containing protein [Paraburkholderia tropica]
MTENNDTSSFTTFYRFRPIKTLLGERQELEKQAIYFASQDTLNDPLEGHINVYWEGDAIVWRNLFRHYLRCVLFCFNLWGASSSIKQDLKLDDIPVKNPLAAGVFPEHTDLELRIFGNESVNQFIERIANSKRKIGRNELTAHLRSMHYLVLLQVQDIYVAMRRAAGQVVADVNQEFISSEINRVKSAYQIFEFVEKTLGDDSQKREDHYIEIISGYDGVDLLNYYTGALDVSDKNRVLMTNDFCQAYVRQLNTLMYPPWYAASFMEDCSAASMWAYYGENHEGVCLKFRAENNENGPFFNMNSVNGFNSAGKTWAVRPHYFKPVNYNPVHTSLNFFENLGATPHPICNSQWYTNRNGEISPLLLRTEGEREIWRKKYWSDFNRINSTKTEAWRAEREWRLTLHSSLFGKFDADSRTLNYDFTSLEGIVFGVRTPTPVKINILNVIKKKIENYKRSDFKFYQTSFTNDQNEMLISEIKALSGDLLVT